MMMVGYSYMPCIIARWHTAFPFLVAGSHTTYTSLVMLYKTGAKRNDSFIVAERYDGFDSSPG
jgi:hypothetical protein